MEVQALAQTVHVNFASAEKSCERIAAQGFLTVITGDHHPIKAVLTKSGRDYIVDIDQRRY
jgi:hypothetical protein